MTKVNKKYIKIAAIILPILLACVCLAKVLKNNKTNPKTDELLTRMTNDVVSGVEKELGVKLHAGIIHLGKPLYDGSVNQYQYFYVKD